MPTKTSMDRFVFEYRIKDHNKCSELPGIEKHYRKRGSLCGESRLRKEAVRPLVVRAERDAHLPKHMQQQELSL